MAALRKIRGAQVNIRRWGRRRLDSSGICGRALALRAALVTHVGNLVIAGVTFSKIQQNVFLWLTLVETLGLPPLLEGHPHGMLHHDLPRVVGAQDLSACEHLHDHQAISLDNGLVGSGGLTN